MSVREMKTSVLFRRLAHRDRLGLTDDEGIAAEIDRRFPVPVERDVRARLQSFAKEMGDVPSDFDKLFTERFWDLLATETDEKARAESKGGGGK